MKLGTFARITLVSAALLTAAGTFVVAQTAPLAPVEWDRRALDRLDRNVRRLENLQLRINVESQIKRGNQARANQVLGSARQCDEKA